MLTSPFPLSPPPKLQCWKKRRGCLSKHFLFIVCATIIGSPSLIPSDHTPSVLYPIHPSLCITRNSFFWVMGLVCLGMLPKWRKRNVGIWKFRTEFIMHDSWPPSSCILHFWSWPYLNDDDDDRCWRKMLNKQLTGVDTYGKQGPTVTNAHKTSISFTYTLPTDDALCTSPITWCCILCVFYIEWAFRNLAEKVK